MASTHDFVGWKFSFSGKSLSFSIFISLVKDFFSSSFIADSSAKYILIINI